MTISKSRKDRSLGKFLRAHRMGEGLSLTNFARFLGISKQRLCDLEHDRFPVSIALAKVLATKLELPPEWLARLALNDQIKREGLKLQVV